MASTFVPTALRATVPLLLAALTLVGVYYLVPGAQPELQEAWGYATAGDTDALAEWFGQFGWYGPAVIILFMVLQLFLVVFPSWLPMVVAVIGYGPWAGSGIGLAGVVAAGLVGYGVGHQLGARRFATWCGEDKHHRLCSIVQTYGFGGVMLFRMSPFLATDAISLVAGVVGMPLRRYLSATVLGTLPMLALIAYFGRDIESLKTGLWWIGGLGLVAYGVFILYRRYHPAGNDVNTSTSGGGVVVG